MALQVKHIPAAETTCAVSGVSGADHPSA